MTDLVQQARAALEGVTQGPWETSCHPWPTQIGTCPLVGNPRSAHHRMINVAAANTDEDIRFIAASRDLVPAMADEIERLRAALEAVRDDCIGRMPLSADGKTVPIGSGAWMKMCAALGEDHP